MKGVILENKSPSHLAKATESCKCYRIQRTGRKHIASRNESVQDAVLVTFYDAQTPLAWF